LQFVLMVVMMRIVISCLLAAVLCSCTLSPVNHGGADAPGTVAIVPLKSQRPLIALVLGAGGTRGFAHVGVIKVLEAEGIEADIVVGTSSGALVASLYAGGMNSVELEELALNVEDSDLLDYTLLGPGFVQGVRLQEFINRALKARPIERLDRIFATVAVEKSSGRLAVFNRGNTGIAVRASASIPRIFWPVLINSVEYVDGGLVSRVPASLAREMGADVVIAVDISRRPVAEAQAADVVIRPKAMRSRINDFQFKRANITAGEQAARESMSRIKAHIARIVAVKSRAASAAPPHIR
jgi:NTE family protein